MAGELIQDFIKSRRRHLGPQKCAAKSVKFVDN